LALNDASAKQVLFDEAFRIPSAWNEPATTENATKLSKDNNTTKSAEISGNLVGLPFIPVLSTPPPGISIGNSLATMVSNSQRLG
jgi:hypothetical protein